MSPAEDRDIDSGSTQRGPPRTAPPADDFGWHGWVLVGFVIFSLVVIPATILFLPRAQTFIGTLGLTLRDAYLVLPMFPAVFLAFVAVWAAVRSRAR